MLVVTGWSWEDLVADAVGVSLGLTLSLAADEVW